jgi:hypothetical protein
MRIYTKNQKLLIVTTDSVFSINDEDFCIYDSRMAEELVNVCVEKTKAFLCEEMYFDTKPPCFSRADTVVFLALGQYIRSLYCETEKLLYDIVFSYNFPLVYERYLVPYILELFDKVVNAQLIALGISSEFLIVNTTNKQEYAVFYERYGSLLRHNSKDVMISNTPLLETLLAWRNYCLWNFKQLYSMDAIDVYSKIYALKGFETLTYTIGEKIMAQGVRYKSDSQKTIYYCIFAWDRKFKSKSPGIFAYAKTIELCHEIGYKFSFCYGPQDYKFRLIDSFERK